MKYYAVLDTNVLVSALLNERSIPGQIAKMAVSGVIVPLYNDEILTEYLDVMGRPKFPFSNDQVEVLMESLKSTGIRIDAAPVDVDMPDKDDVVFYAVVMEKRKDDDAYLVTGNLKHFPAEPFIVTPREMLDIITNGKNQEVGS